MNLTIGFILVGTLALAVLELWVIWWLGDRDDGRRVNGPHQQPELRAGRSVNAVDERPAGPDRAIPDPNSLTLKTATGGSGPAEREAQHDALHAPGCDRRAEHGRIANDAPPGAGLIRAHRRDRAIQLQKHEHRGVG